jgi:segregation and condensation protein B
MSDEQERKSEIPDVTEKVDSSDSAVASNISALQLKNIVEALVMASDKPLSLEKIHSLFELHEQPSKAQLKDAIAQLQMDYAGRGVQLAQVASGYRFQSVSDVSNWVSRLWEERPQRYSRALLETLALVAYRQPITRGEIEEVRGVAVSSQIVKTLLERQWIKVVGHREVPGRPAIYATTRHFLDYFNLQSLEQLPPLSEMRDIDVIAREVSEQLELGGLDEEGANAQSEEQLLSNTAQEADGEPKIQSSFSPETDEHSDISNDGMPTRH